MLYEVDFLCYFICTKPNLAQPFPQKPNTNPNLNFNPKPNPNPPPNPNPYPSPHLNPHPRQDALQILPK